MTLRVKLQIKDREKKKKEKIVQKKSNHPIKMGGRRKAAVDPESRIALPEILKGEGAR